MAAYATALRNVSLAGPTLFGQVVNRAAQIAGQSLLHQSNKYYVLLIITVIKDDYDMKFATYPIPCHLAVPQTSVLFHVGRSAYGPSRDQRCFGEGIGSSAIDPHSWSWRC